MLYSEKMLARLFKPDHLMTSWNRFNTWLVGKGIFFPAPVKYLKYDRLSVCLRMLCHKKSLSNRKMPTVSTLVMPSCLKPYSKSSLSKFPYLHTQDICRYICVMYPDASDGPVRLVISLWSVVGSITLCAKTYCVDVGPVCRTRVCAIVYVGCRYD